MIDVSSVLLSPEFSQMIPVTRTVGYYGDYSRWTIAEEQPAPFSIVGCVQRVTAKELAQLDIGNITTETRKILTTFELIGSIAETNGSDRVILKGKKYRVINVDDSSDYGFYRAYVMYEGTE